MIDVAAPRSEGNEMIGAPQERRPYEFTVRYFVDRLEVELAGHRKIGGCLVAARMAVDAVIHSIEHFHALTMATPIVAKSVGEKKFQVADATYDFADRLVGE
jgi:hypothetical protein